MTLHPLIRKAGEDGELPAWKRCTRSRVEHVQRVADLMGDWSNTLGLPADEVVRWRAAGLLHDALKDADLQELEPLVPERWPEILLHGPACAERLRQEGVEDEEFLLAMSFHSTGHPDFGHLADYLYLADYLEPGRAFKGKRRAALRERLPEERIAVLTDVIQLRIARVLAHGNEVLLESIHYWNQLAAQ